MNIVVVSAFRNMGARIQQYFRQVHALQQHVGVEHPVRVIAVEGDSDDDTERDLGRMAELWQVPLELVKHDHGKRHFGSTEEPERLEALTGVMKAGLQKVRYVAPKAADELPPGYEVMDDVVLYVESDLLWKPHEVGSIIDIAVERREDFDIVAPLIFAGEAFYDIWGFVGLDGERFEPFAPYHSSLRGDELVEISSCGSCFAVRAAAVAKVGTKFAGVEGLRSFCAAARKKKLRIGVAPQFRVDHP